MIPYKATLASPCKLNLTLDVGTLRADGFHEIDSLVVRLSPSDELTVTIKPGPRLVKLIVKDRRPESVSIEPLPKGADNLAHRAAQLVLDTLAPEQDIQVWITLAKRLPLQAGLDRHRELIGGREAHHQRVNLVEAIRAQCPHIQCQVELARRGESRLIEHHFFDAPRRNTMLGIVPETTFRRL